MMDRQRLGEIVKELEYELNIMPKGVHDLIAALEEAWRKKDETNRAWRDDHVDLMEQRDKQRRHRKWALKEARPNHHRAEMWQRRQREAEAGAAALRARVEDAVGWFEKRRHLGAYDPDTWLLFADMLRHLDRVPIEPALHPEEESDG